MSAAVPVYAYVLACLPFVFSPYDLSRGPGASPVLLELSVLSLPTNKRSIQFKNTHWNSWDKSRLGKTTKETFFRISGCWIHRLLRARGTVDGRIHCQIKSSMVDCVVKMDFTPAKVVAGIEGIRTTRARNSEIGPDILGKRTES